MFYSNNKTIIKHIHSSAYFISVKEWKCDSKWNKYPITETLAVKVFFCSFYSQRSSILTKEQKKKKKNSRFREIWRKGARVHIRASRFVRKARCSKKLIKILALPIAWPACSTTLRRAMETRATFVGLLSAETRFSQSVTRSLWSKQLSRAFIEQTGCNQYFIRRKTIEITPFFLLSFPSFSFFRKR